MPNNPDLEQSLADLTAKISRTKGVQQSALVWIQGSAGRMQAALDAAEANGASIDELAPIQAEADAMEAAANEVAAAIAANPS